VCRSVIAVRYTRRRRAQIQLVCEPPQNLCVRASRATRASCTAGCVGRSINSIPHE
jgi:hypothetical protein